MYFFYFVLLRNIHPCIKIGTTTTQKGKETDYNNIDLSIPYSMVKLVLRFCAAIKHLYYKRLKGVVVVVVVSVYPK